MITDKQVRNYFENLSYGKEALASEIHGPNNQARINKIASSLVRNYDKHIAAGDKEMAAHFKSQIHKFSRELDNYQGLKEEFMMYYGGNEKGKMTFSHFTNLDFEKIVMTENGVIDVDHNMELVISAVMDDGTIVTKRPKDIPENWVVKGTEESDFMRLQQSAVKQRNNMNEPLDFDIDWEVSKLLANEDSWKVMVADKIGGRYFLNDYVVENQEAIESGAIPDNMLHPESFDPDFDNRLHQHYANILRKSFDENYQTPAEARKADELIARTNPQDNTEETNIENTQV